MKAIVLCGGLGTRLGKLTLNTPKPILPVAGRPFLEHVLNQLVLMPIDQIILAVSFEWGKIRTLIGDSWCGIPVIYSIERQPLGTGGAIKLAMTVTDCKEALVINGDSLLKIDPNKLRFFAEKHQADVAIALKPINDCSRYGIVSIDAANRIISFKDRGKLQSGLINCGVYYIRHAILGQIKEEKFSFESDFLAPMCERFLFYGMKTNAYFIDMGVPLDFARSQIELS